MTTTTGMASLLVMVFDMGENVCRYVAKPDKDILIMVLWVGKKNGCCNI